MSLADCSPGRRVSAAVFGNRHKLELLLALAQAGDQGVNLSALSDERGVFTSVYYGPIRDLIEVGLVERLGRMPGDRRCWYRRRESTLWDGVRAVAVDLAEFEVDES
ncbi:hypothetical protein AB5J62_40635 [Amycolatopsis sp. cg5]|uniref:hypothetical protein n=1 Tax=Amycolatopsis sp. cg5 TaxID=3238802 RepID=UPI0035258789